MASPGKTFQARLLSAAEKHSVNASDRPVPTNYCLKGDFTAARQTEQSRSSEKRERYVDNC
jgi:hypothetical protein